MRIPFDFKTQIFGPEAINEGKGMKKRHPSWTRWDRALEEADGDLSDTNEREADL